MKRKILSVFVALCLAAGVLGGTAVMAQDSTSAGSSSVPSGTPDASAEGPQIVDYSVSYDNNILHYAADGSQIGSSARATVTLTIKDARLNGAAMTDTDIHADLAGTDFISEQCKAYAYNSAANTYQLNFGKVTYMGKGNTLSVNIAYNGRNLPVANVTFNLGQFAVVTDTADSSSGSAVRTPNLLIKNASYGTESISAGQEFTVTFTVYATAGKENLSDVLVSVSTPEGVSLTGGSTTQYVGSMAATGTKYVSFKFKSDVNFTGGVANITAALSAQGASTGTAASCTGTTVSVPILQPQRFEISKVESQDTMYLGDEGTVSISFVNKGKTPVSNISAEISGTNLANPGQNQYIGNLAAGTENSADFDLQATAAGTMNLTITLSYEDSTGAIKTLTRDLTCEVMEAPVVDPGISDPGTVDPGMPAQQTSGGIPWWGWVIAAAAVAGGTVLLVNGRRRKKAKAAALEGSDEDI